MPANFVTNVALRVGGSDDFLDLKQGVAASRIDSLQR